jgi:hypothetical protein
MSKTEDPQVNKLNNKVSSLQSLAIIAVTVNVIASVLTAIIYLHLNNILEHRSGTILMRQIITDYESFQEMESASMKIPLGIRNLNSSIDLEISERDILETTNTLYNNERDYQLFFRLLKVNVYNITKVIPGTESWYDKYGPEIDHAIERSQSRQLVLLRIQQYYQVKV